MVVLTDRIPQEVLSMNELEFSGFFNELLAYMEKQKWGHLTHELTEDLVARCESLESELEDSEGLRSKDQQKFDEKWKRLKDALDDILI